LIFSVFFVLLNNGVSENPIDCFFEIGGLTASFLSVSKFCAEWHLYTAFNLDEDHKTKIPTKLLPVFKAMSFFVPHSVFRTASLAIMAAYFRLYALIDVYSKLVEVVTVAHVDDDNSLVQIWKVKFGHKV